MNTEIIKYDGCTYQCYLKQMKSRTGRAYYRAFCRRQDPKCKKTTDAAKETAPRQVDVPEPTTEKPERILVPLTKTPIPSFILEGENVKWTTAILKQLQPMQTKRLSAKRIFPLRDFQKHSRAFAVLSKEYVGTNMLALNRNFRADVTAQLEKIHLDYPADRSPEDVEIYHQKLFSTESQFFLDRDWTIAGMIPKQPDRDKISIPYQDDYDDIVLLVDCQKEEVAHAKCKYAKLFVDGCSEPEFGGKGATKVILVKCKGQLVGMFAPIKPPNVANMKIQTLARALCGKIPISTFK